MFLKKDSEMDQLLKAAIRARCKHLNRYNDIKDFNWQDCEDCKLDSIRWMVPHSNGPIRRDLCFAIWHQHILED